ncbi:MAG: glycosyltransferase family 2 protein [Clostridia bacterium]
MSISAIIPAYNEAATIGKVIHTISHIEEVEEIFVVSDGSTDETAEIARQCGAKVIELSINRGKGGAMKVGLDSCNADIVLFLDADLIGLTERHIRNLLAPVKNNQVDMTIGIFDGGRFSTDLAQKISPFLSGQRVIRKKVLDNMCNLDIAKFGVEVALTNYVRKNKIPYCKVILEHMSHVMKEEKLGWRKGVQARIKMYWDILKGLTLVRQR